MTIYIHPSDGGGYYATLNGSRFQWWEFDNLRDAKRGMEKKITGMLKYALRKVEAK